MTNTLSADDIAEVESRQKIYGLLASVFLQKPTLESLTQQQEALGFLLKGQVDWAALLSDIGAVEQSYFDCFFVPKSGQYVPPYESALRTYTEDGKPFDKLNGPATNHIAQCWKETGFTLDHLSIYEPLRQSCMPDHVGLELAFMTFLCGAEKNALQSKVIEGPELVASQWQKYQVGFIKDHLRTACGNFARALHNIAPGYYANIAAAATAWVEADVTALDTPKVREETS
ncbi:chaperone TorD involved in molybdoenzyme TorA maturation [Desulfuromusa kysingii]|uniref:Chaperone TorD involved in molybdoenzyme TorA maturation n=1 Tax=Desulfuromusa kysingii TaxID=37625 RepID=A0A1H4AUS9_9BACT|nr:molecular chaperone TorD family protein [Desulfuromusa kysingii]SEA39372.1 chaperone TorD involved in molybdoenzyme TorA maturation [Desulfuromusa kysingii]